MIMYVTHAFGGVAYAYGGSGEVILLERVPGYKTDSQGGYDISYFKKSVYMFIMNI